MLILIAEDDPWLSEVIVENVALLGYKIIVAGDGSEALEKALAEDIDIVVSDIKMPRMTGIEMLEGIRRVKPRLPFILFSGTIDLASAYIDDPLVTILEKPLDFAAMNTTIQSLAAKLHP